MASVGGFFDETELESIAGVKYSLGDHPATGELGGVSDFEFLFMDSGRQLRSHDQRGIRRYSRSPTNKVLGS